MKDSGREPGRKDSEKPGKAGKNDRSKRDRKLRDTLGNPFLWLVPFLLVVILGWAVFSSMFGYRTIDTSDGLASCATRRTRSSRSPSSTAPARPSWT